MQQQLQHNTIMFGFIWLADGANCKKTSWPLLQQILYRPPYLLWLNEETMQISDTLERAILQTLFFRPSISKKDKLDFR